MLGALAVGVMGMTSGHGAEVTPVITSLIGETLAAGCCDGIVVGTPASVRLTWTVDNPTSTYKLYKDGVLQATQSDLTWDMVLAGLVEGHPSNPVTYAWTFRVDAILVSGAVGASREVLVEKTYGDCAVSGGSFECPA